ncbi:MAG: RNA polymerase sigma factor [Eggerthella lenta]
MRLPFQRKNQPAAARDSPKPLRSDAFLLEAMDAWGDVVYRVALAQTGSPSDADDVFQDVFMRLLENDTAFESDEHLKAWLLRVGEPLPRLGAFDLEPPHGRLTRSMPTSPPPTRSTPTSGGRGRVAARPASRHLFYAEGYAPKRSRASRDADQHRANLPTRPRHCGTCWKTTAANASRACKLPRPPMPKGAEP